ncbi:MAG: RluA family pseudouridine synthase, partial [Alphaproteobacteria bacterium]
MAQRQSKTTFLISQKEDGQKLRPFLHKHFKGLPLSTIHKWCRQGQIRINSKRVKFNAVVKDGDLVRFPPFIDDFSREAEKQNLPTPPILYEDDSLVIVNKPSGISVQGGDKNLCAIFETEKTPVYPVHRIDAPTTGCVILAKTHKAAKALSEQFAAKKVKKTYIAEVAGRPKKSRSVITSSVEVNNEKKSAQTIYKEISTSLLIMRPLTGRKHQLRQHCVKILKTPILGEQRYARNREKDLHLLAYQVEFTHPETK